MQKNQKKGPLSLKKEVIAFLIVPKTKQENNMPTEIPTGVLTSAFPTCKNR